MTDLQMLENRFYECGLVSMYQRFSLLKILAQLICEYNNLYKKNTQILFSILHIFTKFLKNIPKYTKIS